MNEKQIIGRLKKEFPNNDFLTKENKLFINNKPMGIEYKYPDNSYFEYLNKENENDIKEELIKGIVEEVRKYIDRNI